MLKNYIKIAFLVLMRRKFFTFISLFAISFTLIVLIVISAIFDHMLAPVAPEVKADRTLGVYFAEMSGPELSLSAYPGYGLLDRSARNLPNVELMSISTGTQSVISYLRGQKIVSLMKHTDGEYWQLLQFNFLEGGPITIEDEKNANFVTVINKNTKERFFGKENAVGKFIEADNQSFRVVGVVENVSSLRYFAYAEMWVPISTSKNPSYRTEVSGNCIGLILAKNASDFPSIKAEFALRMSNFQFPAELKNEYNKIICFADTPLEKFSRETFQSRDINPNAGRLVVIVMGLMVLFMLLPAINLININISRILERASEIGVRKAFGASSWTLVGQFIVENLILTLLGAILGFIGSIMVLILINHSNFVEYANFQINYRVFFYGVLTTIFFSLLSGVYPAWRMSKFNPIEALRGGVR
ncbi:MAG: Uncharacterized protein FD167_2915 [bacterium]|nr:MAG: Uncharacterized protein FD167_2915 [bacterium]